MNLHGAVQSAIRVLRRPRPVPQVVTLPAERSGASGRALVSYLKDPALWRDGDRRFNGHSNRWESREIARIFASLGFVVDVVDWNDNTFAPTAKYDVVFDIYTNLARWAPILAGRPIKLLHCTGSDPFYQNDAEWSRVRAMNERRGANYAPKRLIADPQLARAAIKEADACSLLGNLLILNTYPPEDRRKFTLIPVTGSDLGGWRKRPANFAPRNREFLWFFGRGAVHKGLDLALEAFARLPQFRLNVVGPAARELDFRAAYGTELLRTDNIRCWGELNPAGFRFRRLAERCFCFVAPSCSEGISPAVVTCMQAGLLPLVSRDTGVTLPPDSGIYLETCSIDEIVDAAQKSHALPDAALSDQIAQTQRYALAEFSRERFTTKMTDYFRGLAVG